MKVIVFPAIGKSLGCPFLWFFGWRFTFRGTYRFQLVSLLQLPGNRSLSFSLLRLHPGKHRKGAVIKRAIRSQRTYNGRRNVNLEEETFWWPGLNTHNKPQRRLQRKRTQPHQSFKCFPVLRGSWNGSAVYVLFEWHLGYCLYPRAQYCSKRIMQPSITEDLG